VGLSLILTGKSSIYSFACFTFRWEIKIFLDIHAVYLKIFKKQVDVIGKERRCSADRSIGTDSLLDCFIMTTAISRNYCLIAHFRTHKHSSLYSVMFLSFDKFL